MAAGTRSQDSCLICRRSHVWLAANERVELPIFVRSSNSLRTLVDCVWSGRSSSWPLQLGPQRQLTGQQQLGCATGLAVLPSHGASNIATHGAEMVNETKRPVITVARKSRGSANMTTQVYLTPWLSATEHSASRNPSLPRSTHGNLCLFRARSAASRL